MSRRSTGSLYKQVVKVTHRYFGPASERFIERQIRNHLNKEPEKLQKKDLDSLIDWIKVAMALLVDNTKLIEDYVVDIRKLNG